MLAFTIQLKPSKYLYWLVLVLYIMTLPLLLSYSHGWWRLLWLLYWGISACWAAYAYQHSKIETIVIDALGQAWLRLTTDHQLVKATLHSHSLARTHLLALRWQTEQNTLYQLLLPDMIEKPNWRRLQVWVRWCQPTRQQLNRFQYWWHTLRTSKSD